MKLFSTPKISVGMIGLLTLLQTATAQFSFPVYEPFSEYPEGERIRTAASSITNWNLGNSVSSSASALVSNGFAMTYPGLLGDSGSPARGILGATGVGRTAVATFTAQPTNTVYLSFLVNLQSLPSGDRAIIGLNGNNSGTPSANSGPAVWVSPTGQLKISKNNSTAPATNTTAPLALGNTYFVVVAYKFLTNADEVDLWLNPTALGGSAPTPTLAITNGTDNTTLQSLGMYASTGTPVITNFFDEFRVHTNWAGVTPNSCLPGATFNVAGGGTGCPGDTFPINVSGSESGRTYSLYTNGVFSGLTQVGTGGAISFAAQSTTATYSVLASNATTTCVGWMNGSPAISVLAGPVITAQPASVLVATNGTGVFAVTATGTGLNYRWYKNGVGLADGGHVSGAQTPTLVISPATTADAGTAVTGYRVIITNSCGLSATSAPIASLTLQPAANLVWQGGNPNTNWDLATTANFTNAAGSAVVFNAGDNVLLDDSSSNQVVTLVGSFISPTLLTDNSSLNYFLTGSGQLSGTAALLMNGSGILTVSNASSFTGGTTISNGTVLVRTLNNPLGTGVVKMAGGKLQVPLTGSAALGVTNEINTVANSTLQYDTGGTFACVLFGALTGTPGTTLTIFNNNANTTLNRVRLYSTFTNNADIILQSGGAEIEIASYLSANNQVFNGVISGNGGRFVPRGAGNLILNGANTFDDSGITSPSGYSLLMNTGNAGFGADSVSSSPPTIDSSPAGKGNIGISVGPGTEGGDCSFFAYGGAHTVGNPIIYTSATNTVTVSITGSNNLTFSGAITLSGADSTGNTNRQFSVGNTGLTTFSGVVGDATLVCGLSKGDTGTLVLSAVNTYTGPTTITGGKLWVNGSITSAVTATNGQLGGTGTITGAVDVNTGGTLAPGTAAIGTLTVSGNLSLSAKALFKLNKSLAQSNDICSVSGTLTHSGTGTLTVTNLGPALVVGDKFKLFSQAVTGGGTFTVTGGGATWTNKLALDGSIQVLSVGGAVNTSPTNITAKVNGGNLEMTWPADHIGWRLQAQTNTLATGLRTNWVDVPNTATVNAVTNPINPANGAVFYRMVYP